MAAQSGEEPGRGGELGAAAVARGRGDRPVGLVGADPVQDVPCRERAQHVPVLGVVDGCHEGVDEGFEAGEVFVAFGQGAGGDEHPAQVLDRHPWWLGIERGVREWLLAVGDLAEQVGAAAACQPTEPCAWVVDREHGVPHWRKHLGERGVGTVEELVEAAVELAAVADR